LSVPIKWAAAIELVAITVEFDVIARDGEQGSGPGFVAEQDVTIQVDTGAVRQTESKAFTAGDGEPGDVDSRAIADIGCVTH